MPATQFLTIDIGKAWTKAFLVSQDQSGSLQIEKSAKQPTSHGDISISTKFLISSLSQVNSQAVMVSRLDEAEQLAKNLKIDFIHEETSSKNLSSYFKKNDNQVTILDAGASKLATKIETSEVGKYLSFDIKEITLENFLGNKSFRPHTIPTNVKELEIEEAFYRNLFLASMANTSAEEKQLLVVSGGIVSGTPNIYRLANILLDVLSSGQVAQVYFDREFFLPSFGALLSKYKQLSVFGTGKWLDNMGALISLGSPLPLELNWGYSLKQKVELTADEIASVPAPVEQEIEVNFTFQNKKRRFTVNGGSLGLLIDAREKPLLLSFGQKSTRTKISSWFKQLEESSLAEEAF